MPPVKHAGEFRKGTSPRPSGNIPHNNDYVTDCEAMSASLGEQSLPPEPPVEDFITRWPNSGGSEKANYQLFLTELCALLDLPQPDPAGADNEQNAYVFERRVDIRNPDGSTNRGFIDLYRRGAFVLEAKQTGKALHTQGWDKAMLAAQNQADTYVRALPAEEDRRLYLGHRRSLDISKRPNDR